MGLSTFTNVKGDMFLGSIIGGVASGIAGSLFSGGGGGGGGGGSPAGGSSSVTRKAPLLEMRPGGDAAAQGEIQRSRNEFFRQFYYNNEAVAERAQREKLLGQLNPFLEALNHAIMGRTSDAFQPQLRTARGSLRREQDQSNREILQQFAKLGGRGQFGMDKLLAQNNARFGIADADLEPRLQADIIRNFLPVLQGAINQRNQEIDRINQINNIALGRSMEFNVPSMARRNFDLNLVRQQGTVGESNSSQFYQPQPNAFESAGSQILGGVSGGIGDALGGIANQKVTGFFGGGGSGGLNTGFQFSS